MIEQFDSTVYWKKRYRRNWDSGAGSYGPLAEYKADFLNRFVSEHEISSVIEIGCGDGAQLDLAEYPQYIGIDVSPVALDMCRFSFSDDLTKCFIPYSLLKSLPKQDLSLSLDVIYHLIEDGVFERYVADLFAVASRYVIIYSSNRDQFGLAQHVRHRKFTSWIDSNISGWRLTEYEANPYSENSHDPEGTSFSDFYVYENRR